MAGAVTLLFLPGQINGHQDCLNCDITLSFRLMNVDFDWCFS
nr:MAG TPA: hypothetical protein [Caudoviricetes sp.]